MKKNAAVFFFSLALATSGLASVIPLTSGDKQERTLQTRSSDDWTITAAAGDFLLFRAASTEGTSNYTVSLALRDPNGNQVSASADGQEEWIYYRATLAGVYTLKVTANTGSVSNFVGTYRFCGLRVPASFTIPDGDEGGALVSGQNYQGAGDPADMDPWMISAKAGDTLLVRCGRLSGAGFDLRLYAPDGSLAGSGSSGTDVGLTFRATLDGTYTVVVVADDGNYRLNCLRVPNDQTIPSDDEGGALTSGMPHNGSITVGDMDPWTITAQANDTMIVRMQSNISNGIYSYRVDVFGPDGAAVSPTPTGTNAPASGLGNEVTFKATTAGQYTIVVSAAGAGGTGNYQMQFLKVPGTVIVPAGDEGGLLANGENYTGTSTAGDLDAWTIAAQTGDLLVLRLAKTSGDASFSPRMRVYSPAGVLVADGGDAADSMVAYRALATGSYTVVVADGSSSGLATGSYALRFLAVPGAFAVPSGDEGGTMAAGQNYYGTITLGDIDAWAISAQANDSLQFHIERQSGTLQPLILLVGPDGAGLDSGYGTNSADITYKAASTGIYTVIVVANNLGGTGDYRITASGATLPPPPSITTPPASQTIVAGQPATLTVSATGTGPLTYQWKKNSTTLPGATNATYTIAATTAGDAGSYTVDVSNPYGTTTSAAAVLTIATTPSFTTQPTASTVTEGQAVTLTAAGTGTPAPTYQWYKDDVAIAGATHATYSLAAASAADAGTYTVKLTNAAGTTTSAAAVLTVNPGAYLSNVSVRAAMNQGQTLIMGFVVAHGSKPILVRAGGPVLNQFGLTGLPDPRLTLYNSGGTTVASNDDWPPSLADIIATLGATPFAPGSKDAALQETIDGPHTAHAQGTGSGAIIAEAYDAGSNDGPKLVNVSARYQVGTGNNILIAGFVVAGSGKKQVLIRAVGPGLTRFGVTGILADPQLAVYDGGTRIDGNDNWDSALAPTFSTLGAGELDLNSKDAALLLELDAGKPYTVQVSGVGNTTGEALVEIYDANP